MPFLRIQFSHQQIPEFQIFSQLECFHLVGTTLTLTPIGVGEVTQYSLWSYWPIIPNLTSPYRDAHDPSQDQGQRFFYFLVRENEFGKLFLEKLHSAKLVAALIWRTTKNYQHYKLPLNSNLSSTFLANSFYPSQCCTFNSPPPV